MIEAVSHPLKQTSATPCPALHVEQLSAGYKGLRYAVENVSFTVQPGERVGVLGPNGAGKSTLFKALVGLLPHHAGYVSTHGENCRTSHTLIGYVPQHEEFDPRFPATVGDVVMMGRLRKLGWFRPPFPAKGHWRRVDAELERVGLLPLKHRQIGALSGGQRRRVFIARALVQETDILLLDEPFTGVDAAAEGELLHVLDLLRQDTITVLMATHNFQAAATQFDKLLLLNQQVVAFGSPQEVLSPEYLSQAYGGRIRIFREGSQSLIITDEHYG